MILVDFNGVAISVLFSQGMNGQAIQENLVRHMILNTLRSYNVKYRNDYGQMILCCDGGGVWRKEIYAHYKGCRAKNRKASSIDWESFFTILNKVRDEIREFVPFKVVQVYGAEADDIIATLVETTQEFGQGENVMIVSADHDFIQLQKYSNVSQFSPMTKKVIKDKNPLRHLREKILRGDSGDGVPNILSDGATFMIPGGRQKPLSSKKVEEWIASWPDVGGTPNIPPDLLGNYNRNRMMVDLSCIPDGIKEKILAEYGACKVPHNSRLLSYLIEKRCSMLTGAASEFFPARQ